MEQCQQIIKEYRQTHSASQQEFADKFSYNVPLISHWENGIRKPRRSFLEWLTREKAGTWIADFAMDCLAALYPDEFQPSGEIGKRILSQSDNSTIEPVADNLGA